MLCCAKLFCLFFKESWRLANGIREGLTETHHAPRKLFAEWHTKLQEVKQNLYFIYIYIIFFPACYPGKPGKLPKRDVEKLLWQKCHRSPESQNCSAQGKKTQSHPITNPSPSHPSAISIGQRGLRCCQVLCTSPSAMSPTVVECMQLPPQSCGGQPL